jgi:hypothetical protein
MKRTLLSLAFMVCCSIMYGTNVTLTVYKDGIAISHNGHRDEIPVVTYDDNTVTVTSDSLIYDAQIVIKDESGNIVSSTQAQLSPAQTQIPLPAEYNNGTYTIEIYYGYYNNQIRLYGEMQ